MEGDLSLSQSLGGLRIANPDDEPNSSLRERSSSSGAPLDNRLPTSAISREAAAKLDKRSPLSIPTFSPLSLDDDHTVSSLAALPPSSAPQQASYSAPNRNRQSAQAIPPNHQAQVQQQFPSHAPFAGGPPPSRPATSSVDRKAPRPASALFLPQDAAPTPRNGGSYRLRSESSRSSMSGLIKRSESRNSASATPAGVPTREGSYSDRTYGQSQSKPAGGGPLPPRRSSRGFGTPHMSGSHVGSPYALEGGPLQSSDEWKERGAAMGMQQELDQDGKPVSRYVKKGVKDFNFGRTLGEGSYSTVIAAQDRQTLKDYAIKVLDKRHIIKEKKVKYVNIEKDALNRLTDHPGIVRLYYTFQDEQSLYFVLDVASGGELLGVLKKTTTFDEECTRFYGAQILDAVEYMHARGVIHRDLKPENVLLDDSLHVKITDFGTAKMWSNSRPVPSTDVHAVSIPLAGEPGNGTSSRTRSFVGTAEYVSPELLGNKDATKACDLWAFGCIIYQLLAGRPPFKGGNEYQTFQKILNLEYEFPQGFPPVAMDLVERLLVLDPAQRLPIEHVKNHEFFDGIAWGRGLWRQKAPRLRSYAPPPQEANVIKLNGYSDAAPPSVMKSHVGSVSGRANGGSSRSHARVITELAPPSQLDIDWSPVLTRTNERILKLGNLVVQTSPVPHSPNVKTPHSGEDTPKKFSRFFGGGNAKKRERLVMVTSSGRILMAAAGGEEKKTKTEISLLALGFDCRGTKDSRGFTAWCVEIGDKLYTFEDPKADSNSAFGTAMEWLETIDRAKEAALSQNQANASYSGDDAFKELSSSLSSPASAVGGEGMMGADAAPSIPGPNGRLSKTHQPVNEAENIKARKRFSKRHSKNGLAAVF